MSQKDCTAGEYRREGAAGASGIFTHSSGLRRPTQLVTLLLLLAAAPALAGDAVPATPASPVLGSASGADPCVSGSIGSPLTLVEAVGRSLCHNPKTREAWAAIRLHAAQVRMAREGWLPDLGISLRESEGSTQTHLNDIPGLDTSSLANWPEGSASMSWLLLDFGGRSAQIESARQLFAAAQANLSVNQQQVFLQVATDYYDAQAAQAVLDSAREIEQVTTDSVRAAHERVGKGIAPVSDELQARTAHAQAVVNRVKAQQDLNSRSGALGIDMGLDPDQSLVLPVAAPDAREREAFSGSVHELIEQAKREHPGILVAQRELAASQQDERAVRARTLPSLSLVGQAGRSYEPLTPNLGSPSVPGHTTTGTIGVQLTVPLSDPLWKRGRIAEAQAQVQVQQEALYEAQQKVAQDVWTSYTALQADSENLASSQVLLDSARDSLDATRHRYEGGVGNILELLNSQQAYAEAAQQRIRALSDWRISRLALGASLGRLSLDAVTDTR